MTERAPVSSAPGWCRHVDKLYLFPHDTLAFPCAPVWGAGCVVRAKTQRVVIVGTFGFVPVASASTTVLRAHSAHVLGVTSATVQLCRSAPNAFAHGPVQF